MEARVNYAHFECSFYLRYFQFTLGLSECNPIVYQDATLAAQMVKNLSAMQETYLPPPNMILSIRFLVSLSH